MKVTVEGRDPTTKLTEMLVLGMHEHAPMDGFFIDLDRKLDGMLSQVMMAKEFEGKYGQVTVLHTSKRISPKRVLLLGLGKKDDLTLVRLGHMAGRAAKFARSIGLKEFSTTLYGTPAISLEEAAHTITEWSILGSYRYDDLKTEDEKRGKEVEYLTIIVEKGKEFPVSETIKGPVIEAEAANYARRIANTPANIATTEYMAAKAKELAKEVGISCKVYGMEELRKMKMNALIGVGQGSKYEPKLIVLDYNPKGAKRTVAVVGKTIVFDSGGISIKPSANMGEMKFDKSGGCFTLGIMRSVAQHKLPVRVIGLLPTAENLPSGSAQRPGDIVTSASGKTIEIDNTDAEGRLVMSDAFHHALGFKPDVIVDLATLTGAIIIALGKTCAGMFTNDRKMGEIMVKAGELSTERVWELPAWDDYWENVRSDVADVKNLGARHPEASAIAAAMFLRKFAGKTPWVHLDIAGTAWESSEKPYMFSGSTGFGVRLVTEFIKMLEESKK